MSRVDGASQTAGTSAGLTGLMGLQAWVWSASVLPKVTSATFLTGFVRFVGTAPPTRPAIYSHLVTPIVLAAPALFAVGALVTELALAVTFIAATLALLRHRGSAPRRLLALNLAHLAGDAAPWTLGDPFASGVAIEYLLVGLSLVTAGCAFTTIRASARQHAPARADRDWWMADTA